MSSWQVYKFGGSSLGAEGRLPLVLRRIAEAPRPLAVVVSALGDTTEWLLEAGRAAAAGDEAQAVAGVERAFMLARTRAAEVLDPEAVGELIRAWRPLLGDAGRAISALVAARTSIPAMLDLLLSVGERASSELVAAALLARGLPGLAVDARDVFATDGRHGDATVNLNRSLRSVLERSAGWERHMPVVTGFIGRGPGGETTTLGRNGSDYAATTLAALLGASEVTIWTDVGGVMTADPGLVDEAYPVPRLTWHEAQELAHFGLRMFHLRTVLPLEQSGGRLRIRSTVDAGEGTVIDGLGNPDPHRPTCVTSLENLALLSVESRRSAPESSLAVRVLSALDEAQLRVWMVTQSGHGQSLAFVLDAGAAAHAHEVLESALADLLATHEVELPQARSPVSLVSLVGEAMGQSPNVAGRFFGALGNVGINILAIAQGASSRSISSVVGAADTSEAVRTVHAAFNLAETEVNVLLLGRGTVGGRLLVQLEQTRESLRARHGIATRLFGVVDGHGAHLDPRGLTLADLPARSAGPAGPRPSMSELLDQLSRRPVPVLVDCTAADGMETLYVEAFRRGIHVVAANKKPLALAREYRAAVAETARRHHRAWHYETTVGAGLPIIETLKNLVATGDVVERIDGSLSGTLGFLSQEVMAGTPLSVAVRTARDRGYTEPHPRDDLSGLDVARKALILARELGLPLELEDVAVEPFVDASLLTEEDPERFLRSLVSHDAAFAAQVQRLVAAGRTLRYLVQIVPGAEGRKVRVGPVPVEAGHPAVPLRGAEALVAFTTARYRDYPLIVRGAGAGGDVTAAGVLADVLRLTQNVRGRR